MKGSEIRNLFLNFYRKNDFPILPSTSLIPQGDPTLLFTSAGMVPLKPYFLGLKTDLTRAASCQKCFRTTDIDRVGTTARHLTFFEMLGNFSFGDYFKEGSLTWGWDFITKEMKLDPKRIYVTIYKGGIAPRDEEALAIWRKLLPSDLRDSHISELGEKDNFWTMGPTGPCGPCSEIYFDFGPGDYGRHDCAGVGCDCDRYMEFWNHVFTQFDRQEDGAIKMLPKKNIDTGMGLERLVTIAQGKRAPFDTDLFTPIADAAADMLRIDRNNADNTLPLRVISDHSRACAFLISEGITPSNEGRGYVLRRLIRRAVRYGKLAGRKEPFLHSLVPQTMEIFGSTYPDLLKTQKQIQQTLLSEEERFMETLESGERMLAELTDKFPGGIPGDKAFNLYETYGFPLELTREIAQKKGVAVDEKGFEEARAKAQELAKSRWKGSGAKENMSFQQAEEKFPVSVFTGYNALSEETTIAGLLDENGRIVKTLDEGDHGYAALALTPFYAESGGQVGDTGVFCDLNGNLVAEVEDTQRPVGKIVFHKITARKQLSTGMEVRANVNRMQRKATACNHTAVHVINSALREVLGPGVRQAGSYVSPERFRFDYTAAAAPTQEQTGKIEVIVNAAVQSAFAVCKEERPLKDAEKFGATTLLGEKYADPARFVLINEHGFAAAADRYSLELCGGTHVDNTAELMTVKILKDSSLSAGVRRIEGVAGPAAMKYLQDTAAVAEELSGRLGAGVEELSKRVDQLIQREKDARREIAELKEKLLSGGATSSANAVDIGGGKKLVISLAEDADVSMLRGLSDKLRQSNPGAIVVAAAKREDKISFVVGAPEGADACAIARGLAVRINGKGGGRKDFAQGGGDAAKWAEFHKAATDTVKETAVKA
jgi:alanyl-tRNA synthetase